MPQVTVKIENLDKLIKSLKNYPETSRPILAKAINASLLEIEKEATDDNFQFKTARPLRTGYLQLSFKYGFRLATEQNLVGKIGPTARYAIWVHEGTSRGVEPNPFMVRIVAKAERKINEHFKKALELITEQLAK